MRATSLPVEDSEVEEAADSDIRVAMHNITKKNLKGVMHSIRRKNSLQRHLFDETS